MTAPFFAIPYYHDYLPPALARHLLSQARPLSGIEGLQWIGAQRGLESPASLAFLARLYEQIRQPLAKVLRQRQRDREFFDVRTTALASFNAALGLGVRDLEYQTALGLLDGDARSVFGPLTGKFADAGGAAVQALPQHLLGAHVTFFAPLGSSKAAIEAMNVYHQVMDGEPPIVAELLRASRDQVMWGADGEDSTTPLPADLVEASATLSACYRRTLQYQDQASGTTYTVAPRHAAVALRRLPGLGLPCTFAFFQDSPIPLHVYDFALHLYAHWDQPEALCFYIPKLENEEEAAYLASVVRAAEALIKAEHPNYRLGSIRLLVVLENPRALFRVHEIIDALYPYFAGASLGWHDFLAATARWFKNDPQYRIPVKMDPDIVVRHIKASHELVARVVGSRGGIAIGGMYGVLPTSKDRHSASFQIALKGFFRDAITQLRRGLTGFWLACPDFVRIGLALVQAWRRAQGGDNTALEALVQALLQEPHATHILDLAKGQDAGSLDPKGVGFLRTLIVADVQASTNLANNDAIEVRYNVAQSLRYLSEWLAGRASVALAATIEDTPVNIMDDLATLERSRWEVWHELRHGRFAASELLSILHQELRILKRQAATEYGAGGARNERHAAYWYETAAAITLQLMTAAEPCEFVSELLLPFTLDEVRSSADPYATAKALCPGRYRLDVDVAALHRYFEACGCRRFATEMAKQPILDLDFAASLIKSFSVAEIIEAASFHGDIGESAKTLDAVAAHEQAGVVGAAGATVLALRTQGEVYRQRFGFKFLISAKGKSADFLLAELEARLANTLEQEIANARSALAEITLKRLGHDPAGESGSGLVELVPQLLKRHQTVGVSIAVARQGAVQSLAFGEAERDLRAMTPSTSLQLASLSKTLAALVAVEYCRSRGISLDASVNQLLKATSSRFCLGCAVNPAWADQVSVRHLMNHTALSMHYVHGFALDQPMPRISDLLNDPARYGYEPIQIMAEPGQVFHYSGGGYLVLEHLLEAHSGLSLAELSAPLLAGLGLQHLTFTQSNRPGASYAHGYMADGSQVASTRLMFPAMAAGAMGTAEDMLRLLLALGRAYRDPSGCGPISHDAAREVVAAHNHGSRAFMGCDMGLGVFVAEAGDNKIILHQGANEGFRALYAVAIDGPDQGKGMVVLANGDNNAVPLIADVARALFKILDFSGIEYARWPASVDTSGVAQEQLVNLSYKALLFDAFLPTLPPVVTRGTGKDPRASFNILRDARILAVSNQRFARAENIFSEYLPTFDPELFCRQGKVMDSWETARHNRLGVETLDLELKLASSCRYVWLSSKYHDGNQAEAVRISGSTQGSDEFFEILPWSAMLGHAELGVVLPQSTPELARVRIEMRPDGGLSRVGLYSDLPLDLRRDFVPHHQARARRYEEAIPKSLKPLTLAFTHSQALQARYVEKHAANAIDYASALCGARIVRVTNEHYGPSAQVLSPYPPLHMFDGLESARSRQPGHREEVEIELAQTIKVSRVVLDFSFFVNNNPYAIELLAWVDGLWAELVGKNTVKPFAGNFKEYVLSDGPRCRRLLLRIYPDGGVNRLHVYGVP